VILLATGGTGGHIYPAVAVAGVLRERGHEVALAGQRGGMEERIAAGHGLEFHGLHAGKWDRGSIDPRWILGALNGLLQARALLRRLRPRAVVGFGGFAAFPAVAAAQMLGIATALHEQNARPGRVNLLVAPRARVIATAEPSGARAMSRRAPGARVEVVGMPIVERRAERCASRRRFELDPYRPTLLIFGGSLGSPVLNELAPRCTAALGAQWQVLHGVGRRFADELLPRLDRPGHRALPYIEDMPAAYAAADLALTRAGAMTIAELAYHRVPSLLVPWKDAADAHQAGNARALERAGAAAVLEEHELDRLPEVLSSLAAPERRARLAGRIGELARPGAAAALATLVEELL
jgi:UDP-N-acetylglucosamine--N-acetylmuramyl-(pentapeptide) pyrophosphoryl-undecaprenol N-acetylglucosamine transferase